MFLLTQLIYAQPVVTIITNPDVSTIIPGAGQEIAIIARTKGYDLAFKWSMTGPGSIEGDTTAPGILYIPPAKVSGESVAIIRVTVTDSNGKTATDEIKLTFTAQLPIPAPVPTPTPKPTATPLPELQARIAQLIERADTAFAMRKFITPKDMNAFDTYQEVLALDPANQHARESIQKIANAHKKWGDETYERKDYYKAQVYYERYLYVGDYIITMFDSEGQNLKQEYQEVQKRIKTLILAKITPTPSSPPEKSEIPQINCLSQTKDLNELLQQSLPEHLERYKELKTHENQGGENLHQQFIITIESIICDLLTIERILQEHYDQTKDTNILQRLQKVKQTRKNFEEERTHRFIVMEP